MCQAFDGERDYMNNRSAWIRSKGYNAQKADNPESDHPIPEYSDKVEWELCWETTAVGRELW